MLQHDACGYLRRFRTRIRLLLLGPAKRDQGALTRGFGACGLKQIAFIEPGATARDRCADPGTTHLRSFVAARDWLKRFQLSPLHRIICSCSIGAMPVGWFLDADLEVGAEYRRQSRSHSRSWEAGFAVTWGHYGRAPGCQPWADSVETGRQYFIFIPSSGRGRTALATCARLGGGIGISLAIFRRVLGGGREDELVARAIAFDSLLMIGITLGDAHIDHKSVSPPTSRSSIHLGSTLSKTQ